MAVEFASSLLNRPSTPRTSNQKNNKGYLHSESQNSKTQTNVDLSWLPNHNDNKSPSESGNFNHPNDQNDFDDSWLPGYNDTQRNNNSNRFQKMEEDDSYHSWLPPTHNGNKNKESSSSNRRKKWRNQEHWMRAREVVFSGDQQIQQAKHLNKKSDCSRSVREVSPCKSECSVETSTLGGVSTLLRRWKDMAETKSSNRKAKICSQSNNRSRRASLENNNPLRVSDAFERCTSSSTTEDSFLDWESCKTSPARPLSCPTSSHASRRNSNTIDDADKDKIRVVDIIKKLSREEELAASQANDSSPHHQLLEKENKGLPPIIGSPRFIRGRQAFKDFLMLKEQNKMHELENLAQRKPVSKFKYRGRIQALLRVILIRIGAEFKTEAKSLRRTASKTLVSKQPNIMDLRDRFSTGVKQGATTSRKNNNNEEAIKKHATVECVGSSITSISGQELGPMTTSNQSTEVVTTITQEQKTLTISNQSTQKADDHGQSAQDTDDSEMQAPNIQDTHHDSIQLPNENDMGDEKNSQDWVSDSEWDEEEEECYDMQHDWISTIARPRRDWEDMRQARYQEMLESYLHNRDIRELLERRSVSSFLSSGLQDKIEQLLVSRTQGRSQPVMCLNERKKQVAAAAGRESREEEEEEDYESKIERQCSELSEYNEQTMCSQSPVLEERSWSHPNTIYDSDQMASPSVWPNPTPPHSYHMPSMEMELINALRGHMEQLHQEMMELRKSIKSIANMEHSIMQNVAATIAQSVQKMKSDVPQRRNCCVCYATQVDSFLYRCGHMCTCFDCSLKLQSTSGKCPVCDAPILDVVKAYAYAAE